MSRDERLFAFSQQAALLDRMRVLPDGAFITEEEWEVRHNNNKNRHKNNNNNRRRHHNETTTITATTTTLPPPHVAHMPHNNR